MQEKSRWQYRFNNYKRAFSLLREAIELKQDRQLSALEEEGVIQRFEYAWQLAWKTLKDYLENDGVVFELITPKAVIIAAIEAKVITRREDWMNALDDRNKMSHVYNEASFIKVIDNIERSHLSLFDQLYQRLLDESIENEQ